MQDYIYNFYGRCDDDDIEEIDIEWEGGRQLAKALDNLSRLAPAMVSCERLGYDPEHGFSGTIVIQLGAAYDENMMPDPDDVADLVDGMNYETSILLEDQEEQRKIYGPDYSFVDNHFTGCGCDCDCDEDDDWDDEDDDDWDDDDWDEDEDDDWDDPLFSDDEEEEYVEGEDDYDDYEDEDEYEDDDYYDDEDDIESDESDPVYPKCAADELLAILTNNQAMYYPGNSEYTYTKITYEPASEDCARKEAVNKAMHVVGKATGLDEAGVDEATIDAVENLVAQILDLFEADPDDTETLILRIKDTVDEVEGSMTKAQKDYCTKVSSDTLAKLQALFTVIGK